MRLRDTSTGVLAVIALTASVLAVGGALRWSEALVAILVALASIPVLMSRRTLVGTSPLLAIYAIAIALCALQLVPLPEALRHALEPVGDGLRSDGTALAGVSAWPGLSLDAPGTLHGLAYFTILLGAAAIALRFAVTERGRLACLGAVASLCGATAMIVGIHRVFGATSLYGLYEPVQATPPVLGPLLNANHLGGLMALGAVVAIGLLLYEKQSIAARAVWALSAVGCIVVLLETLSRGALLGFLSGLGVALGAFLAQRLAKPADRTKRAVRRKFVWTTLPIGIVAVCGLIVIIFTSAGTAADQLQSSSLQEISQPKSKFAAWRSATELVAESPWVGVGRGAMEPAFTRVHPASAFVTFSHVENEYVQAVVDWGIPGALLLAGAIGWLAVVAIRRWRDGPLAAAALGGLTTLAVQSNVDFGAELLGLALPATVVAATLAYVPLRATGSAALRRARLFRYAVLVGLTGAALILLLPITRSVAEDHVALAERPTMDEIRASIQRHPLDYYGYAVAASQLASAKDPTAIAMLNHALVLHPTHPGLHRFAGRLLLAAGHVDQAAIEYGAALRGTTEPHDLLYEIEHAFPADKAADAIPLDYDNIGVVMKMLEQDGRGDVALAWIERVAAQHPRSLAVIDFMYDAAMDRHDAAAAERAAAMRVAVTPTPHALLQLSQLLAKRGANEEVTKQLADVANWHGKIDEQVTAWLLLCDTWLAMGKLDDSEHCVHRLDGAGLLGPGDRGPILQRLDTIVKQRNEQCLREQLSGSAAGPPR